MDNAGRKKNQIDYILVDKRYGNGWRNCTADCGSGHDLVIARMHITLQRSTNIKKINKKGIEY